MEEILKYAAANFREISQLTKRADNETVRKFSSGAGTTTFTRMPIQNWAKLVETHRGIGNIEAETR